MSSLCKHFSGWLFSSNSALRVRSSMAMLAVLLMAGGAGVMLWLGHAGYGWMEGIRWWCVIAVSGQLLMALLVRYGVTANWRDPAMTFAQVMWAVTCSAGAFIILGDAKGVVPGLLAVSLLFAALNLQAREIVAVTLYALGMFSLATLWSAQHSQHQGLEIGYAAVLLIMLVGCMLLSLRLFQLRKRLRKQRQELAQALEENRELASRDPLTGLLNRRCMRELLLLEQSRSARGGHRLMLAQMDIDHFKSINDTYGHLVGDLALKIFADLVRSRIRSSDAFCRWGGEEFVLLLSDTSAEGALIMLERIRQAVQEAQVTTSQASLQMTVSIGLAEHRPGESMDDTLERADRALYRAKHAGRNCVVLEEKVVPSGQL